MTTKVDTDQIGTIRYYKDEKLHREDGPAAIYASGTQKWYDHGYLHREDGPAVIWYDGNLWWYQNGKRHREDGPAVMWFNGKVRWYFDDKLYTFKDWCAVANISDQQKTLLMIKYNTHDN